MTFGSRLKKARENRKLSQLEVSKITNINNKTLSRYENDGAEPDFKTLKTLSELYKVPISYFFGEADNIDELLKDTKLTWGPKELSDDDRGKVIEILNLYQSMDSADRERAIEMMKVFTRMKKDT